MVSLLNYIPGADAEDAAGEAPASASPSLSGADAFPPLPSQAAAAPSSAGGSSSGAGTGEPSRPASAPTDNPLLAAFAAERRAMEALRDDVQARLASFRVRRPWMARPPAAGSLPACPSACMPFPNAQPDPRYTQPPTH